jgi:Putative transposase DNA-binding domain
MGTPNCDEPGKPSVHNPNQQGVCPSSFRATRQSSTASSFGVARWSLPLGGGSVCRQGRLGGDVCRPLTSAPRRTPGAATHRLTGLQPVHPCEDGIDHRPARPARGERGVQVLNGHFQAGGEHCECRIDIRVQRPHRYRSVGDAGWSQFRQILQWQATKAAKVIVVFSAKDTIQRCSRCGEKANPRMGLSDRVFRCRARGLVLGRDRNAARNQNPDRPRPGDGTEPPGTDPVGANGTKSKMPVGAEAA